jgi:hypothetical protein
VKTVIESFPVKVMKPWDVLMGVHIVCNVLMMSLTMFVQTVEGVFRIGLKKDKGMDPVEGHFKDNRYSRV